MTTKLRSIPALLIFAGTVLAPATQAQDAAADGVYIIFDGSGSMWGQLPDETHKIEAARTVLREFLASDFGGKELALRVYGHRREGDCSDTELVEPFSASAAAVTRMQDFVDRVNPKGKTPISRSLRAALADFGDRRGEIILISDGVETCDEDPCELVRAWQDRQVKIRVHVVGLGLADQERAAMECISVAAGTEYQDAGSTAELAASLAKIKQIAAAAPEPAKPTGKGAFLIRPTNSGGERRRAAGTLRSAGGKAIAVTSNRRNDVDAGSYVLEVGVETRNGNIYRPVTKNIEVAGGRQETIVDVVVEDPPTLEAKFFENGKERTSGQYLSGQITAFQNGEEVFRFRRSQRIPLDEGTYEFRISANPENPDLSVTESFAAGDHKVITFEMVHTVHASIKMVAAGSGIDLRKNYELWQDGAKVKGVHWSNGVWAVPGTYDLRLPDKLTPYVHEGLVLKPEKEHKLRIEVPVGHLTVIYQKADGTRNKDERIWVARIDSDDPKVERRSRSFKRTGRQIPLTPGRYRVEGWDRMGTFDPVEIEIAVGEDKEVVLRDQG
ncbi:MAG: hypothetical protein V3T72_05080 [Thermoanaerobaculia bacterium]